MSSAESWPPTTVAVSPQMFAGSATGTCTTLSDRAPGLPAATAAAELFGPPAVPGPLKQCSSAAWSPPPSTVATTPQMLTGASTGTSMVLPVSRPPPPRSEASACAPRGGGVGRGLRHAAGGRVRRVGRTGRVRRIGRRGAVVGRAGVVRLVRRRRVGRAVVGRSARVMGWRRVLRGRLVRRRGWCAGAWCGAAVGLPAVLPAAPSGALCRPAYCLTCDLLTGMAAAWWEEPSLGWLFFPGWSGCSGCVDTAEIAGAAPVISRPPVATASASPRLVTSCMPVLILLRWGSGEPGRAGRSRTPQPAGSRQSPSTGDNGCRFRASRRRGPGG